VELVCVHFRMDDRKQRLVADCSIPEGQRYFGWEVADSTALDTLAARLDGAGVAVKQEPAALADQRFVSSLISFADPSGNRLEAFHGAHIADEPFQPGRSISGFRTGPLGMGHAVLMVTGIEAALPFYRDLLGFRISDYIRQPITAYFLHVNPRHHSLDCSRHLTSECITSWSSSIRSTTWARAMISHSARRTASPQRWDDIPTI
jgi:catechol 2,3-dioxygenase-like lactoylglutathione lyase family enzyme